MLEPGIEVNIIVTEHWIFNKIANISAETKFAENH